MPTSKSKIHLPVQQLSDLNSIGPAMLGDFQLLGVHSVSQLAQCDPNVLYNRLCRITAKRQDPCVLDTFTCAVAQAKNPNLPKAQRNWWYWSRVRKSGKSSDPFGKSL